MMLERGKHNMNAVDVMFAIGLIQALMIGSLGVVIARGHTVGGLTFCNIGRFGFSFYWRK